MTATAHTIVAGAIASKFTDPTTAASLALLSHFIMDTVPHWDIGTSWRNRSKSATGILAVGETSLGILVGFFLFRNSAPITTLSLAILLSLLPDWLETPWYIFFATPRHTRPGTKAGFWERGTYRIYKWENYFHTRAEFPIGVITQIVTIIFFLAILA